METPEQYTVKTPAIVKFLLGECDYQGLWYGDASNNKPFWWRTPLRKEVEELIKENERLRERETKLVEDLKEALTFHHIENIRSAVKRILSKFQPKKDENNI